MLWNYYENVVNITLFLFLLNSNSCDSQVKMLKIFIVSLIYIFLKYIYIYIYIYTHTFLCKLGWSCDSTRSQYGIFTNMEFAIHKKSNNERYQGTSKELRKKILRNFINTRRFNELYYSIDFLRNKSPIIFYTIYLFYIYIYILLKIEA